jgi:hypothetical protein
MSPERCSLAELAGTFERGCRGRVGSPGDRLRGGGIELAGDRLVGALGHQRSMPGAANRIVEDLRQRLVGGTPLTARR